MSCQALNESAFSSEHVFKAFSRYGSTWPIRHFKRGCKLLTWRLLLRSGTLGVDRMEGRR